MERLPCRRLSAAFSSSLLPPTSLLSSSSRFSSPQRCSRSRKACRSRLCVCCTRSSWCRAATASRPTYCRRPCRLNTRRSLLLSSTRLQILQVASGAGEGRTGRAAARQPSHSSTPFPTQQAGQSAAHCPCICASPVAKLLGAVWLAHGAPHLQSAEALQLGHAFKGLVGPRPTPAHLQKRQKVI
jgi:hypothetical protein